MTDNTFADGFFKFLVVCGIFVFLQFGGGRKRFSTRKLISALDTLEHRGPDAKGWWEDDYVFLGSRRLKIIDLSDSANMPLSNEDGTVWVVFNGEIYNFRELRRYLEGKHRFKTNTDTEVIVHLWEEMGEECVKALRGMFAFAIWDTRRKVLFLARDRIGKKPLKFYIGSDFFVASSELKAIASLVPLEVDWSAVEEYLTYQYVPHPKTGFVGVKKLEHATAMTVTPDGLVKTKKYWQLDMREKWKLKEQDWVEIFEEKFREAVKIRTIADVPLGAHLSGGVDSSMVVAFLARELGKIKTFSVGFKEDKFNELPYARKVAKMYSTDHTEIIVEPEAIEILPKLVWHYEEPYADSSALPTWYLCRETKRYITVALNGDGGDENFAGYTRYVWAKAFFMLWKALRFSAKVQGDKIASALARLTRKRIFEFVATAVRLERPEDFYKYSMSYFRPEHKKKVYTDDFLEFSKGTRSEDFLPELFKKAPAQKWMDKVLWVDINSYLADDLVVKVDIASNAHALEVRSPFLDHELLELTAKIPPELKLKGFTTKYLLKRIARKWLPHECIDRPKQGFGVPLEQWFRTSLYGYLREELLSPSFLQIGLFKKEGIERMIEEHKKGEKNHYTRLWALLFLKKWLDVWTKGKASFSAKID